jgi:hypothetical protein
MGGELGEERRRPMADTVSLPRVFDQSRYFAATGYYPHLGQLDVQYDTTRHQALSNGRRWGKTYLGAKKAEATAYVLNKLKQPQRGWIVGPNYTDCEKEFRIIYNSLKALDVDTVSDKFTSNVESGNMHIATNWGWDIQCKSAAHPESLVGEGLDFVLLVEAGRLRRVVFTQYIRPALSDKRGWSMMTGVPEIATDTSLLYWGYSRGQDSNRATWKSWKKPSWTNNVVFPGGRNDPEILEAEEDLTEDEFARQYGGEFVEKVGRVLAEWDDDIHLANLEYNPNWPLYAAVDYGYTNPFVWLWIQVDEWGNTYVLGEHYITLKDTYEIAKYDLLDHPLMDKLIAFYPDPAEPDDTATLQRVLKRPSRSNTGGPLKDRLALIRSAMKVRPEHGREEDKRPGLVIDRSCTRLAWECREGYRWPRHKSEVKNDTELPMDKDNHGPEALGRFFKGYHGTVEEDAGHRGSRQKKAKYGRRRR